MGFIVRYSKLCFRDLQKSRAEPLFRFLFQSNVPDTVVNVYLMKYRNGHQRFNISRSWRRGPQFSLSTRVKMNGKCCETSSTEIERMRSVRKWSRPEKIPGNRSRLIISAKRVFVARERAIDHAAWRIASAAGGCETQDLS